MLQDIPTTFVCDICQQRDAALLLCLPVLRADHVVCAHCCHCPEHDVRDMAGTVVFSGTPLAWRGLRP